jgi:4,5-dihydroxyphthalate decarboxylase
MNRALTIAIGPYAHVAALRDGRVQVDGLDLRFESPRTEQILQGMLRHQKWEVAEFSFAQYVALRHRGDESFVAIPIFPSRVFRHGSMFVRRDTLTDPRQLTGARVGIPEWAQTAGIWMRGILRKQYGVELASVDWIQAEVNEPGLRKDAMIVLPPGVSCTERTDASLDGLLRAGDLDAVLSARPPAGFGDGSGEIVRLVPDYREVERAWWRETGIFPIMHVVVIRRDVYEQGRWIARTLLDGFTQAKRLCVGALHDRAVSTVPLPWVPDTLDELEEITGGGEWWPYGIEPNRATLDAFLRFCREQGLASAGLELESLFAPEAR